MEQLDPGHVRVVHPLYVPRRMVGFHVVRVSVLELPARWNGATEALAQVDALLAEAPTDLAILPEAAFTGYVSPRGDFDLTRFAEPIDGPTATAIAALARRHRITLVAPLVLAEDERVYNTAIVAGPDGRLLATYRKRHPWAPERWAAPGPHPLPLFRVGEAWHVFVVEGGRAREVAVRVGQRNRDEAQVLEGLTPGTAVVRYPGTQLKDGSRVRAPAT